MIYLDYIVNVNVVTHSEANNSKHKT